MSLSESAIFNENSSYYAANGSGGGGVTSFNGLTGDVVLQAVPNSIAISGGGNSLSLTTTGRPQAPTTVDATDAITSTVSVSAPLINAPTKLTGAIISGDGFGGINVVPVASSSGAATLSAALGSTGQFINFVIGNTRIQAGSRSTTGNVGGSATFVSPFAGLPIVWTSLAGDGTSWVVTQSESAATFGITSALGNPNQLAWLAIGPA
jgi:hypothetical protein